MNPCRNCGNEKNRLELCNLGYQPLSNQYLTAEQLYEPEAFYPLVPTWCEECGLIQLPPLAAPEEIFNDYAYFSSQSAHWVKHINEYANHMVSNLGLNENSRVLEIASNDGAMLRAFRALGIPALGIEPARNVALTAQMEGLATECAFMGVAQAEYMLENGYRGANLIAANNVMAHVPDLDDFLTGIEMLLAPGGVLTVEFPDAALLVQNNLFDTIYHEHFSYFTADTATDALSRRGLSVYDAKFLPTHGGSIRLYAKRGYAGPVQDRIPWTMGYSDYWAKPDEYRRALTTKLLGYRDKNMRIVGYGAPAKGNTLINYCGLDAGTIEYVVDSTPEKQGKFLPGSRIPVHSPDILDDDDPDVIMILPWNWSGEIVKKLNQRKQDAIILCQLEEL